MEEMKEMNKNNMYIYVPQNSTYTFFLEINKYLILRVK